VARRTGKIESKRTGNARLEIERENTEDTEEKGSSLCVLVGLS
jgi:hypothetical protein